MKRHDQFLLSEIEQLSYIESKLINKIKNYSLDQKQFIQKKKKVSRRN